MSFERFETSTGSPIPLVKLAPANMSTPIVPAAGLIENHIYGLDSRDPRSRPFNLLRGQVLKIARAKDWRIIGVTSATPRAGKSFIASNLAAALGRSPELQTYLFDLDLRRSTIASNFLLDETHGLSDYLDGTVADITGIARDLEGTNLTIFPTFPKHVLSAELLANARMDGLLEAMRATDENTLCICDLPPVFANDDAVIMAGKIDAFLLVIEEGVTTRKQIRDAFGLLQPTPCMGTVLNRYEGGLFSDDYGYGYGQSGKYAEYYR